MEKENYKRYVKVESSSSEDCYGEHMVPTMEEYNDFCKRVSRFLDKLDERITALENSQGEKMGEEKE